MAVLDGAAVGTASAGRGHLLSQTAVLTRRLLVR